MFSEEKLKELELDIIEEQNREYIQEYEIEREE